MTIPYPPEIGDLPRHPIAPHNHPCPGCQTWPATSTNLSPLPYVRPGFTFPPSHGKHCFCLFEGEEAGILTTEHKVCCMCGVRRKAP